MKKTTLILWLVSSSVLSLGLQTQTAWSLSAVFPKNDSLLLVQIQQQIAKDAVLSVLPIQIAVKRGQVSISGTVDKKEQAIAIIVLAQSIAGVQAVTVTHLSIRMGDLTLDDQIESTVIGLFYREGLMGPLSHMPRYDAFTGIATSTRVSEAAPIHIQVKTQRGIVYLSGTAANQETIDRAINLAKSIDGVNEVKSTLTVENEK